MHSQTHYGTGIFTKGIYPDLWCRNLDQRCSKLHPCDCGFTRKGISQKLDDKFHTVETTATSIPSLMCMHTCYWLLGVARKWMVKTQICPYSISMVQYILSLILRKYAKIMLQYPYSKHNSQKNDV